MSAAPDWLVELLAEHARSGLIQYDCKCGVDARSGMTPHHFHLAEVLWENVAERINEAWENSNDYGPFFDAEYLLDRLGPETALQSLMAKAWNEGASFVASSSTGLDRKTWNNPYERNPV